VIEGFDDPFNLMRDIISFYYQVAQEEPEFAHFHEIVDMQELKSLLEEQLARTSTWSRSPAASMPGGSRLPPG